MKPIITKELIDWNQWLCCFLPCRCRQLDYLFQMETKMQKKRKVESLFLEYYWRSIRDRHSFSSHDCNYCPNQDWRTKKLQKKVKCKKHEIVWLIFHKKAEVQIGSYFLYLSKHGIDMHINQVIFRKILSILRYRLF